MLNPGGLPGFVEVPVVDPPVNSEALSSVQAIQLATPWIEPRTFFGLPRIVEPWKTPAFAALAALVDLAAVPALDPIEAQDLSRRTRAWLDKESGIGSHCGCKTRPTGTCKGTGCGCEQKKTSEISGCRASAKRLPTAEDLMPPPNLSALVTACSEELAAVGQKRSAKLAWTLANTAPSVEDEDFQALQTSPEEILGSAPNIGQLRQAQAVSKPSKCVCRPKGTTFKAPKGLSRTTWDTLRQIIDDYALVPQRFLLQDLQTSGFNDQTAARLACRVRSCGVIAMEPGSDDLLGYLSVIRAGGRGLPLQITVRAGQQPSADQQLVQVLKQFRGLFGIPNPAVVDSLLRANALQLLGVTDGRLPGGGTTRVLIVDQRVGGNRVTGAGPTLIRLLDGAFIGFSGNICPNVVTQTPTSVPKSGRPDMSRVSAAWLAARGLESVGEPTEVVMEFSAPHGRHVWRVSVSGRRPDGEWVPLDLLVDTQTMEVLAGINRAYDNIDPSRYRDRGGAVLQDVLHYQVSDVRPNEAIPQADRVAMHSFPANEPEPNANVSIAMLYGGAANRTPIWMYDTRVAWRGKTGYYWTGRPDREAFLEPPESDQFSSQHVFYWASRAFEVIDSFYDRHPPVPQGVHPGVTIIDHFPGRRYFTSHAGCEPEFVLREPAHGQGATPNAPQAKGENRVSCIHLGTVQRFGPASAFKINPLFHEIGHVIDARYQRFGGREGTWEEASAANNQGGCDQNTSDEGRPLSETIGGLYSMALSEILFGNANWMTYNAGGGFNIGLTVAEGTWHDLRAARGEGTVHVHASAGFTCVASSTSGEASKPLYQYGAPMLQAYWQILKHTWCVDRGTCVTIHDQMRSRDVVDALFHASRTISDGWSTYRAFAQGMIEYLWLNQLIGDSVSTWDLLFSAFIFQNHGLL